MEISVPLSRLKALGNAEAVRQLDAFRERFSWAKVSRNGETPETTTRLNFDLSTAPTADALIAAMRATPR